MKILDSRTGKVALVGAAVIIFGATVSTFAADECKEVRVMVTAGPEEDILIKYAKSDFETLTGITASIETVSRDLWPSRAAREFTDDTASYDLVALNSSAGDPVWVARGKSQDLRKLLPADTHREYSSETARGGHLQ